MQGWAGTLLLPHNKKSPPPTGFTGHLGIDPDDEQVEAWCMQGGNLGVRLPQGVIGIDVDWYKPEGQASYSILTNECGGLPATYKSSARPQQVHSGVYLYRVDWQLKLHDKPMDGIEIIQFHHRYICTWPSIHPDGEMYRLTSPAGMMGVRPPLIDELPWLPETWLKRLLVAERPQGVAKPLQQTGGWAKAVSALYAETQVALMGAGRHDAMRHGVDGLVRLESLEYPGSTEALQLLGVQFVNAIVGDGTRTPAEAHSELQRLIDGARELVGSTPSYRPSYDDSRGQGTATGTAGGWSPISPTEAQVEEAATWAFGDIASALEADLTTQKPEVLMRTDGEALLYRGRINALYGTPGGGKTFIALLAIKQAAERGQHSLYIDWEDSIETFLRRLLQLGMTKEDILEYCHYIGPTGALTVQRRDQLLAEVEPWQLELVVMDSTGEAMALNGLDQNKDPDVAAWMALLPRPLAATGVAVVLIDHVPKAVDVIRQEIGSQRKRAAISGATYEVIQTQPFSKSQAGEIEIKVGKDRGGNYPKGATIVRAPVTPLGEGNLRIVLDAPLNVDDHGRPIRYTGLMEAISRYVESRIEATKAEIKASVKGRVATKLTALEALIEEGYLDGWTPLGEGTRYRVVRPYREADDTLLRGPDSLE
jgi:hypothetical protein